MNYEQNNESNNKNNYPNNVDYNYHYNNSNMNSNGNDEYYVVNDMPLSYHIKRFLIGLLLVALLIFLLLWLFPTKAGLKATIQDSISDAIDKEFTEKLNPLYDRIFSDNLSTMKEVATAYFTTDRLPKNEGETKKLTLGEMLDMKLLLGIKDKNGNMCDRNKSYVEITKMDKEYKMKINLSCDGEEDYIISYLGCYNYCLNDVCEKKTVTAAKQQAVQSTYGGAYTYTPSGRVVVKRNNNIINRVTTKIKYITKTETETKIIEKHVCGQYQGKYYGKDGKVVSKETYIKQCTTQPEPEKHYCGIFNGKYYGKYGKVVSKETYIKQCTSQPEPEKHYCVEYNGKYYGKYGKVVSKETYIKQCTAPEPEKHYCVEYNGKYYGKYGKVVNKETYIKQCTAPEPEKHYCEIYDGKYYGKNGDVVNKETYTKQCTTPEPEEPLYKYLYEKIVTVKHEKEYSKWSDWSGNIEYNPNNNNINWGQHEYEWNEKVGYKLTKYYEYVPDKNQPIYDTHYDRIIGYKKQYACNGYTYYIDSTTNTTYKTTGQAGGSGWTSTGRVVLNHKPADSSTKRYVFVGMDYDRCLDTCTLKPYYIFDVQTRSLGTATTTATSTSYSTVKAVCNNVVTKNIPIYGKRTTFAGYVTNKVYKEKRTYYYHRKTRTLVQNAYIDKKIYRAWAYSSNEPILLNQGYEYTGTYERIK